MAWATFNISEISLAPDIIAPGEYTFQLLGAKYSERDPSRLEVTAAIVSEGDFAGRKMFFSYPDPSGINPRTGKKQDWSAKAFKQLEQALGVDMADGEDAAAYLNRASGSRFEAPVTVREYETEAGQQKKSDVSIFKVRPAA